MFAHFRDNAAGVKLTEDRRNGLSILTFNESHATCGRYKTHFLGHSPKSIADRHYAAPSEKLCDEIMQWLHGQIFARK